MKRTNLLKSMLLLCALVAGSGSVWADGVYRKQLYGPSIGPNGGQTGPNNGNYTNSTGWNNTYKGFSCKYKYFNNNSWNQGWEYVKCGNKTNATNATITTNSAIDEAITKVVINVGKYTAGTVTSSKLEVASDADFTKNVQTINADIAAGNVEYTVTSPAKNRYYRLTFVCTKATSNGSLQINAIDFYASSVSATVSSVGWTTFSMPGALDFSTVSTAKAYKVTGIDESTLTLSELTGTVPANTGLLISGSPNAEVIIPAVTSSTTNVSDNKLVMGQGDEINDGDKYVLVARGGKAVFAPTAGSAAEVPVGKAYLDLTGVTAPEFILDDSETTGIESVNSEVKGFFDGELYNLSGQRVTKPVKGLYIVKGKKVIIK